MSPDVGHQEREREMMMELQVSISFHPFSYLHNLTRESDSRIRNVCLSVHN